MHRNQGCARDTSLIETDRQTDVKRKRNICAETDVQMTEGKECVESDRGIKKKRRKL